MTQREISTLLLVGFVCGAAAVLGVLLLEGGWRVMGAVGIALLLLGLVAGVIAQDGDT